MNDENQDIIRNTLYAALNTIYEDHGVCITEVTADWLEVNCCEESKKLITFLEIEVE